MTAPVADLMSKKVVTVNKESTVFDVAREILNHDIGCVIVVNEKREIIGIVTKGDILREAVMKRLDPQKIGVEEIMSKPVVTIEAKDSLAEASSVMSKRSVSKLPVVGDNQQLVGIISSTDIVRRAQPRKLARDMV
jgi:tRNA nucleotidyltransferase (CCA-adding enzyme)